MLVMATMLKITIMQIMMMLMLMILPRRRDKLAWLRPLVIAEKQVVVYDAE